MTDVHPTLDSTDNDLPSHIITDEHTPTDISENESFNTLAEELPANDDLEDDK